MTPHPQATPSLLAGVRNSETRQVPQPCRPRPAALTQETPAPCSDQSGGGRWQASSWPWVSMATMDCGPTSRTAVHPAWGPYLCQTGRDDTAGPRCGISPHLEPHKQVEVGDTYYKPQRCSAIPRGHEPLSSPPFLTPKAPESELSGEFQGQCSPGCAREQQCWGVSTGLCSLLPSPPS